MSAVASSAPAATPEERALVALAKGLRVQPVPVWRMQRPDGSYCMEWDQFQEREARRYYAEHQAKYPENAAQYEIARVELLSAHDELCNKAADLLMAFKDSEAGDARRLEFLLHRLSGAALRQINVVPRSGGLHWGRIAIDDAMSAIENNPRASE